MQIRADRNDSRRHDERKIAGMKFLYGVACGSGYVWHYNPRHVPKAFYSGIEPGIARRFIGL